MTATDQTLKNYTIDSSSTTPTALTFNHFSTDDSDCPIYYKLKYSSSNRDASWGYNTDFEVPSSYLSDGSTHTLLWKESSTDNNFKILSSSNGHQRNEFSDVDNPDDFLEMKILASHNFTDPLVPQASKTFNLYVYPDCSLMSVEMNDNGITDEDYRIW